MLYDITLYKGFCSYCTSSFKVTTNLSWHSQYLSDTCAFISFYIGCQRDRSTYCHYFWKRGCLKVFKMPVAADDVKSSWADEVELEGGSLPPPTEVRENDLKYVTEYKYEDDKKLKIVRTYKIEKRVVSKTIAARKTWKKFGECANDKPGPNPATTIVAEEVYMQYITSKEEDNKTEDDNALDKLKGEDCLSRYIHLMEKNWQYTFRL